MPKEQEQRSKLWRNLRPRVSTARRSDDYDVADDRVAVPHLGESGDHIVVALLLVGSP